MSTQLILYPQNHNGVYSSTATIASGEFVADANFSTGITLTAATINAFPEDNVMIYNEPNSSWRAYRTTGGSWAASGAPTVTTALNLPCSSSSDSVSGVYQLISNLTAGLGYDLNITFTAGSGSGFLEIGNQHQNSWIGNTSGTTYTNLGNTNFLYGNGITAQSLYAGSVAVVLGGTSNTYTANFTASATEEVLVLRYQSDTGQTLSISNISITETITGSTVINYSDLSDGQVICDLYEEESIPLSLSIDDFKNVAEKTQSYSKDFHLPNTKRNNKIFGHIFEITRSTGLTFNPYVKTRAILKEDSYTLFEGFLQLIDINDKEGEISYNVNLFSESVTLKDILENKTFADIDFVELQHDYTITNIKNSWVDTTGLVLAQNLTASSAAYEAAIGLGNTNVLKYPFVNWRGDWSIDASGNIGLQDLEQVFRPFIQIRYLIKKIIHEAGFDFVSDFFDSANFKKLFMDFNWGQGLGSSEVMENWTQNNFGYSPLDPEVYAQTTWTQMELGNAFSQIPTGIAGTYVSGNTITATRDNTNIIISFNIGINREHATGGVHFFEAEWQRTGSNTSPLENTGTVGINAATGAFPKHYNWSGQIQYTMQTGDTITPYFRAVSSTPNDKVFQGNGTYQNFGGSVGNWWSRTSQALITLSSIQVAATSLLHAIRGELSQWEFLKGIMTMFNLVVLKEEEVLRIEPYADIFITGSAVTPTQHNWTDKVDISEINLKPLELTRNVKFSYAEDDDDYPVGVYKKATSGYLYGTLDFDGSTATPSQVSNLTGEEETIATPFAPTLIRPAADLFDPELTIPHIYSGNDDGTEFEDFENAPRILYNVGVKTLPVKTYFVPGQNNVAQINSEDEFLQFGHLSEIPTTSSTLDYNFGACQLIQPIGSSPVDNLFQVYYSPYYDELYHTDTRVMTLKVHLTPADIQNFKFYDTVLIKNREYRVNKIEYKPKTLAKVEFILIP